MRANATNIREYVDGLVADHLIARKSLEFWQEVWLPMRSSASELILSLKTMPALNQVYEVTLNDGQKLLVKRSTPYWYIIRLTGTRL